LRPSKFLASETSSEKGGTKRSLESRPTTASVTGKEDAREGAKKKKYGSRGNERTLKEGGKKKTGGN